MGKWGLCRDEFTETDGWPHALYVRESRRMEAALMMTEHHCLGTQVAEDPSRSRATAWILIPAGG